MKSLTLAKAVKEIAIKSLAPVILATSAGLVCADAVESLAKACAACHSVKGVSNNPLWPNLAGQHKGYLASQIRAFRDGDRQNPLMYPMVKGLSDQQIAELATYFSRLPAAGGKGGNPSQAGRHVSARCISCHGMEGRPVNTEWPIIRGQQKAYLQKQLTDIRDGVRHSEVMKVIVKDFTDQQIADVAEYYSQLPP